ncbi:MAG: hypothetical protein LBT97_02920 [Planctomycetota bacterium]|jgi:hypothetical protein|nr:hypothetical protein [Planctomycetota bacterium]
MLGIIATARLGNIVCGYASLWGIESDSLDYVDDIAREIAHEAASNADRNRDAMIRHRAEQITALATAPRGNV